MYTNLLFRFFNLHKLSTGESDFKASILAVFHNFASSENVFILLIHTTNHYFTVNSEANARRIQMVESCFGGSGEQLLIPGRVLVGEGVLTKMCRKRPKPRQFFLFNDILVYGNIIIGKKKYNKQHIIPLEEVQLQGLDDTPRELSLRSALIL